MLSFLTLGAVVISKNKNKNEYAGKSVYDKAYKDAITAGKTEAEAAIIADKARNTWQIANTK